MCRNIMIQSVHLLLYQTFTFVKDKKRQCARTNSLFISSFYHIKIKLPTECDVKQNEGQIDKQIFLFRQKGKQILKQILS